MKQLNWYQIFGKSNIPDGRTVLPTDDIQTWLNCADIWNKTYTTLAEVLADTDTLLALISSNNAVDYMVRSTTWAVSQTLVPVMTDNTHPSGECSASSTESPRYPWKAFDNDSSTFWNTNGATGSAWIQYKWDTPCTVYGYYIKLRDLIQQDAIKLSISSDGVTFTDITENISVTQLENKGVATKNIGEGTICRLTSSGASGYSKYAEEIQFYTASITIDPTAMTYIGQNNYASNTLLADSTWCNAICNSTYFESVLNAKVPAMTSNTTPEGVASGSSKHNDSYNYYLAFNGNNNSTGWLPAASDTAGHAKVDYQFPNAVKVYVADVFVYRSGTAIAFGLDVTIQSSEDGVTYSNISNEIDVNYTDRLFRTLCTPNGEVTHYAMCITAVASGWSINNSTGWHVQFYGRKDV